MKRWRHTQTIQVFDALSYGDAKKVHLIINNYLKERHEKLSLQGQSHAWISSVGNGGQVSVFVTIEADKLGDMNSLIIHVIHAVRFLAFLYYYNPSWPTYSEQTKLERQNPRPIYLFHTPDEATAERLRLLFQHALDKDEFKLRIAKYLSAVYVKKFDYNNGLFSVAVDLITDRGIPFENEGLEKILELVTVMVEKLLVDPRWLIERTDKIARGAGEKRP